MGAVRLLRALAAISAAVRANLEQRAPRVAPGQLCEEIAERHPDAILGVELSVGLRDLGRVREHAASPRDPLAADAAGRAASRDAHAPGRADALDLARVALAEDVVAA